MVMFLHTRTWPNLVTCVKGSRAGSGSGVTNWPWGHGDGAIHQNALEGNVAPTENKENF